MINAVKKFTSAIGCTTDVFNARQTELYTALQLEELAEKLDAIFPDDPSIGEYLHNLSLNFKLGLYGNQVASGNREGMLDADIDLAWVTIGSALSQGADVQGAFNEVARANMAKLVERDGELVALKDKNGKVIKPEGWTAPDLAGFICHE